MTYDFKIKAADTATMYRDLASARYSAPAEDLQLFVGIGVKPKLEQVCSQLDGGRDLVDVLPPRPGRGKEGLAERLLGDLDVLRPHPPTR